MAEPKPAGSAEVSSTTGVARFSKLCKTFASHFMPALEYCSKIGRPSLSCHCIIVLNISVIVLGCQDLAEAEGLHCRLKRQKAGPVMLLTLSQKSLCAALSPARQEMICHHPSPESITVTEWRALQRLHAPHISSCTTISQPLDSIYHPSI